MGGEGPSARRVQDAGKLKPLKNLWRFADAFGPLLCAGFCFVSGGGEGDERSAFGRGQFCSFNCFAFGRCRACGRAIYADAGVLRGWGTREI